MGVLLLVIGLGCSCVWVFFILQCITVISLLFATLFCYPVFVKGLYKKREWWYYQPPTVDGVRRRPFSLRTKLEHEAMRKVVEFSQDASLYSEFSRGRMDGYLPDFLDYLLRVQRRAPSSVNNARNNLSRISADWGNPRLADLDAGFIRDWHADLCKKASSRGGVLSQASVVTYLRHVSSFFSYCKRQGIIARHPIKGLIRVPKIKKTRRQQFCTPLERDFLLAELMRERRFDLAMFFYLGFFAGLRPGEILAMRRDWVYISADGMHGSITVQATDFWKPKDVEMRVVPLHTRLLCFLRIYMGAGDFVFAPDFKVWKEPPLMRYNYINSFKRFARKRVTRIKVNPYTLRHTFATQLAQNGVQAVEIASMIGSDIRVTTDNYIGHMPNQASRVNMIK